MSRTTAIEWTEHTWNPFAGCSIHTAGCTNCYAMRQAFRIEQFGTASHYQGLTKKVNGNIVWTGKVSRASDSGMRKPFGIKAPALIFVNSMSDFWHENAQDAWRIEALEIMRSNPSHTFQVLTKRPENALRFFDARPDVSLPDNFWFGVTVEHRNTVDRLDLLRQAPAALKFVSFEPLVGSCGRMNLSGIDWCITGGESGVGHRPCDHQWIREIHEQTREAGAAHFFKQWGHWSNNPIAKTAPPNISPAEWVSKQDPVGKGGSLLDGVSWKEMPEIAIDLA